MTARSLIWPRCCGKTGRSHEDARAEIRLQKGLCVTCGLAETEAMQASTDCGPRPSGGESVRQKRTAEPRQCLRIARSMLLSIARLSSALALPRASIRRPANACAPRQTGAGAAISSESVRGPPRIASREQIAAGAAMQSTPERLKRSSVHLWREMLLSLGLAQRHKRRPAHHVLAW